MPRINAVPMRSVPKTRAEFEHNIDVLRELFEQERISLPPNFPKECLLRMRTLPNGRTDFNTVDERARLLANMMSNMNDHPDDYEHNGDDEGAGTSD